MGKFTRDTVSTFVTNSTLTLIGLVLSILIARGLGPEGRGLYSMCMVFSTLLVSFSDLGVPMAAAYYTAHGDFEAGIIAGNNLIMSAAIGALAALVGVAVVILRPGLLPGVPLELVVLTIPIFLLTLAGGYLRHVLLGSRYINELNFISLVQAMVGLAAAAALILLFKLGIKGLLFSLILSGTVAFGMTVYYIRKFYGQMVLKMDAVYVRRSVSYGGRIYFAGMLSFLNYRADVFILNYMLNPFSVGIYATAVGLAEQLWAVSQAASGMLFPRIAAEKDEAARNRLTPIICRVSLLITIIGALFLAVAAPIVISVLYSGRFLPAVEPLRVILFGTVTLIVWKFLANDIAARGRPEINIITNGVTVAVNIGTNLVLIPRFGIAGAAWASVASYTVAGIMSLYFYKKLSGNPVLSVVVPQKEDLKLLLECLRKILKKTEEYGPACVNARQ